MTSPPPSAGAPVAQPAASHAVAAGDPGPHVYPAAEPYIADNGSGGFCIAAQDMSSTNPAFASAISNEYESLWGSLGQYYLMCGTAAAGGPATPTPAPTLPPAAIAASYWAQHGQDLLARPNPRIAPGYALAGKLGYLETQAPTGQQFVNQTLLGPLTIAAQGSFLVDWGDGSGWQGPYDTAGAPWPIGQITHAWDDIGQYDVTVVELWTAAWSLGGDHGNLAQLRTQGSIPQFDVRQLESVRNR